MAAGMQQHDVAGRDFFQRRRHAREIQFAVGAIIGIGLDRKPAAENSARWFSQLGSLIQTFAAWANHPEKFGAEFQRAGAAEGLDRGDICEIDLVAKNHLRHGGIIAGETVDRRVGMRRGLGQQGFLRLLHASQQGNFAVLVLIDADSEIDAAGSLSATKASVMPRIGSRGSSSTFAKREFCMDALDLLQICGFYRVGRLLAHFVCKKNRPKTES